MEKIITIDQNIKNSIKVLFTDVDGTLTDGKIYFTAEKEVIKVFHVHDGLGIKKWLDTGKAFGVISGNSNEIVKTRMSKFGVPEQNMGIGIEDKRKWLDKWLSLHKIGWNELAYIGDDENDLAALKASGLSIAPNNAIQIVKDNVNYICNNNGGKGVVREIIDILIS